MPLDVTPFLDPRHTAIVNMECQERLLGPETLLPGLARAAESVGLVGNLARLFEAGRAAGVRVYYCTDDRRPDGFGLQTNTLVHLRMQEGRSTAGGHGPVVEPLTPKPEDVVFRREQGLTGFYGTGLDGYLRNTGVRTLVVTGVSLNIAVLGTAIEAMNNGYTVVVPSDGVASDPPEYAEHVLRYTMRNIAFVVPCRAVADAWSRT